ncbi:MAG: DNA repair protein RecO [Planctomycetota bacterium]|nr:DNA repair protein RecO [Planctomycetota bacterium]
MSIHRDHALILKRTPFGESSLVIQVITASGARVHVLARGAYRPRSRFYCVLDLFDTLELEWSERTGASLGLLRKGTLARRRSELTRDLDRYQAGLTVLELCRAAARQEKSDRGLYLATEAALEGLQDPSNSSHAVLVVFQLAFLHNLGLAPALEACAQCAGPAPALDEERVPFSAGAGGRLCTPHAREAQASGRRVGTIPESVLECAEHLARCSPSSPPSNSISDDLIERVRDLTARFIDFHLETRLASQRAFLETANRNAPERGVPTL